MRRPIRQFVRIVAETLPLPDPIYEFGAFLVSGQEELADLRPLFPGRRYVGSDLRKGPGVDCLLDLHNLALADGTVGTALLLETLEHVEFCRRAIGEVHRVLQPGGFVAVTSMMQFPIHNYPFDYWRFTPEAFRSLLRPFDWSFVDAVGEADAPHIVIGVACKGQVDAASLYDFEERMRAWHRYWNHPLRLDPFELPWRLFVPPILRICYRRWRPRQW